MAYQSSRYTPVIQNPDGTTTRLNNKRAFHVFSDQDIKIFNADNMALFYNYEDYFYEVPEVCKPENCGMYSTDFYAINAGKVYSIYGMSTNSGMLGYAKPGLYEVHPDMVMGTYGVMLFDTKTSTFYNTSSSGSSMNCPMRFRGWNFSNEYGCRYDSDVSSERGKSLYCICCNEE